MSDSNVVQMPEKIVLPRTKQERKKLLDALIAEYGCSRALIKKLGVPWPPQKGWKKRLIEAGEGELKSREKKKYVRPKTAKGRKFYKSEEWAKLRYDALKKSDGRCSLCGRSSADGARLNVDHIKPVSQFPELKADPGNLQVLCNTCNWGKGNRDDTDWREPDVRALMGEMIH